MNPTIFLIGKNGQIGRELNRLLPRLGEVVAPDRQQLDLTKPGEIRGVIRAAKPQLIVNAAAFTKVDEAELDEAVARAINTEAPGVIAEEAKRIGAGLIHYSTDYLFDGLKGTPYTEDDTPNPQNVYGRTKLGGEAAIQQGGVPHLIFRTAWIYSSEGDNFLIRMLELATQQAELRIVADQIGAPTWSEDVALATTRVLAQFYGPGSSSHSLSAVSGIYNMTAAGEASRFHFAEAILEEARRNPPRSEWFKRATSGKDLIARRILPVASKEFAKSARRPLYSVLSNDKLACAFKVQLPDWRERLRAFFAGSPTENL